MGRAPSPAAFEVDFASLEFWKNKSKAAGEGARPTWFVKPGDLEAEQVRRFHEQSPPVILQPAAVQQVPIHVISQRQLYILQIAVVADVKRGAGMQQVRDQKIGIEIPGGFQKGKSRVGQNGVVLSDEAE